MFSKDPAVVRHLLVVTVGQNPSGGENLVLAVDSGLAKGISVASTRFEGVDSDLMLKARPGVFVAGEMLDWEAPTGGYLLTGCLATGRRAGLGSAAYLASAR